jgi:molecular chaperone GrpE
MSNDKQPQQENEQELEQPEQVVEDAAEAEVLEISEEQQRIVELESALAKAEATILEQKDGVLRAKADMENARRRAEGEVAKARKFALEKFAGELLPVADNLERALQMADTENESLKPMIDGVDITLKSFFGTIDKFGLKVIDPQGEAFNPEQHQAMSMQENADLPANTVMAVMQKGYEINGRLLRPAMVMVSRAPDGGVDTQA